MKKRWVKLLLVLATVLAVLCLRFLISSVHSKDAVNRYKEKLRAAGEILDSNELIPPHVDPEKNGLEYFNEAFRLVPHPMAGMLSSNPPPAMKMMASGKAMVGWQQPEIIDDSTNSWADLEQELQSESSGMDFLRRAAGRPQLNFELAYSQGAYLPLPHLIRMKNAAMMLSPAVLADLHRGNSASAATNLHALLLMVNVWKDEPILISQLVRIAIASIAFNAQWEFLQATNITDEQLAMLENDWTNARFVQPMENALVMERAWASLNIQKLRTSTSPSSTYAGMFGSSSARSGSGDWLDTIKDVGASAKRKTSDTLWHFSWSYDDELNVLQGEQVLIESARQIRTDGYFKNALAYRDRQFAALGLARPGTNWLRDQLDDVLAGLGPESVQSVAHVLDRLMAYETFRTLATSAIALKRYQLRHGTLPPALTALVPEFLSEVPRDPADGNPLRYRVNPNGAFLLYSVGKDGIDDGGDPTAAPGSTSTQLQRGRDWVWPQPATAEEIQKFYDNLPK